MAARTNEPGRQAQLLLFTGSLLKIAASGPFQGIFAVSKVNQKTITLCSWVGPDGTGLNGLNVLGSR